MKWKNVVAGLLVIAVPVFGFAQGKAHGHGYGHSKQAEQEVIRYNKVNSYQGYSSGYRNMPPAWAPAHGYRAKQHVYFPDYHVFYDPYRGGYSYWNNGHWAFSQSVPMFMSRVNLGKARVKVLGGLPLTTHPEDYYDKYLQMYPANRVNISIPIPGL